MKMDEDHSNSDPVLLIKVAISIRRCNTMHFVHIFLPKLRLP